MLKEPTIAGWGPASKGRTWRGTLGRLVASLSRAPRPERGRLLGGRQEVAGDAQRHPPALLLRRLVQMSPPDDGPHVVVGLEQAGDELALVGPDQGGRRLQVDIGP